MSQNLQNNENIILAQDGENMMPIQGNNENQDQMGGQIVLNFIKIQQKIQNHIQIEAGREVDTVRGATEYIWHFLSEYIHFAEERHKTVVADFSKLFENNKEIVTVVNNTAQRVTAISERIEALDAIIIERTETIELLDRKIERLALIVSEVSEAVDINKINFGERIVEIKKDLNKVSKKRKSSEANSGDESDADKNYIVEDSSAAQAPKTSGKIVVKRDPIDNKFVENWYIKQVKNMTLNFTLLDCSQDEKSDMLVKHEAFFRKMVDSKTGTITYEVVQAHRNFNMERFIKETKKDQERSFESKRAYKLKDKQTEYAMKYNSTQIQFHKLKEEDKKPNSFIFIGLDNKYILSKLINYKLDVNNDNKKVNDNKKSKASSKKEKSHDSDSDSDKSSKSQKSNKKSASNKNKNGKVSKENKPVFKQMNALRNELGSAINALAQNLTSVNQGFTRVYNPKPRYYSNNNYNNSNYNNQGFVNLRVPKNQFQGLYKGFRQ